MKKDWKKLSKISGILTIIFTIITIATLSLSDFDSLLFSIGIMMSGFMQIGIICTLLFIILWGISKIKTRVKIVEDEKNVKLAEQRRSETEKKEQQKAEAKKAYEEISDIWEYGEKTMLAVAASKLEEIGIGGGIYYVKLKYTNNNSTPWVITINDPTGDINSDFKVQRKGNSLIGTLKNDKIIIMTKGQLTLDDSIFLFDTKSEHVREISELMKELLNGKKIETVRLEHLKAAGEDAIDALPKFHFSFTKDGIKCDEINYPKKHLEAFFEKNNGGEHIFQNKIFYTEYCKNKGLYHFGTFDESDFEDYMRELDMQAVKSGYVCKTDFELAEWQVSLRFGVEKLFKTFKSYVDKKTLDVAPFMFKDGSIHFKHKTYSLKNKESMMFFDMAIASMIRERADNEPLYFISKTEDGDIIINIDDENFVSLANKKNN